MRNFGAIRNKMKKFAIEFKWAVRYIFIYLAWVIIEKYAGVYDARIEWYPNTSMAFYVFAFALYYAAVREKRDTFFKKEMHWKQGCTSGFYMAIFAAMLMPLAQVAIHKGIAPEFFPNMIQFNLERGNENAGDVYNLQSYLFTSVFFTLSIGVVYAALVAYFLKTPEKK